MTVLLPFRRHLLGANWLRNLLWRSARAIPSLDLDFTGKKSLKDGISNQDLVTFTRASSATYTDSAGVIQTATTNEPRFDHSLTSSTTNLLLQSEDFSTTWSLTGLLSFGAGSAVNATTAPNNTDTADLITENTSTGNHFVQQSVAVTTGTVYTVSVYAKLPVDSTRQVTLFVANTNFTVSPNASFNLSSGTVVNTFNGTASIVSLPNNWYRLVLTTVAATSSGSNAVSIRLNNGTSTSYTGDGTSGLYLWGAELEQSSSVGPYVPTTTAAATSNTTESLGLLVEEARTNLKTFSDAILTGNGYQAQNSTLTTVTTTTPTASTTASLFTLNSGANTGNTNDGFNYGVGVTLANSTQHTQSLFVKPAGATVLRIRNNAIGGTYDFTLTGSGTAPSISGGLQAASIVPFADGWYRVSWTFTTTTTVPGNRGDFWAIKTNVANGTSGLYVVGAQLEAGAFATSYIPTTTATVTRAADVASISGSNFSSWYNHDEGTLRATASIRGGNTVVSTGLAIVNGIAKLAETAVTNNSRSLLFNTSTSPNRYGAVQRSAVSNIALNESSYEAIQFGKYYNLTTSYVNNSTQGLALSVDGRTVLTNATAVDVPVPTRLLIGAGNSGSSVGQGQDEFYLNGTIKRLTYWPTRLSNTTLQQITQS